MKSRHISVRPFKKHEEHISIVGFGIDTEFGTGIAFFGIAGITIAAIGGGLLAVNWDQKSVKDSPKWS